MTGGLDLPNYRQAAARVTALAGPVLADLGYRLVRVRISGAAGHPSVPLKESVDDEDVVAFASPKASDDVLDGRLNRITGEALIHFLTGPMYEFHGRCRRAESLFEKAHARWKREGEIAKFPELLSGFPMIEGGRLEFQDCVRIRCLPLKVRAEKLLFPVKLAVPNEGFAGVDPPLPP